MYSKLAVEQSSLHIHCPNYLVLYHAHMIVDQFIYLRSCIQAFLWIQHIVRFLILFKVLKDIFIRSIVVAFIGPETSNGSHSQFKKTLFFCNGYEPLILYGIQLHSVGRIMYYFTLRQFYLCSLRLPFLKALCARVLQNF